MMVREICREERNHQNVEDLKSLVQSPNLKGRFSFKQLREANLKELTLMTLIIRKHTATIAYRRPFLDAIIIAPLLINMILSK